MENVKLRKMTAFAAALALAAQNGMAVLNAEETADVTVTAANTEQTSTDASEDNVTLGDFTVTVGELKLFSPEFRNGSDSDSIEVIYKLNDDKNALLMTNKFNLSTSNVQPKRIQYAKPGIDYIIGLAEGEVTYTCKDYEGNVVGTGKVTVKAPDEINDPTLVSTGLKPVEVIKVTHDYDASPRAYIRYDNDVLYCFKNGTMEEYQKNVVKAAVNEGNSTYDIYTLTGDGQICVNGHAVNDINDYKVISTSNDLSCVLCSDGCVRKVSSGKAEVIYENIKAIEENFNEYFPYGGFLQTSDGKVCIAYNNTLYPLGFSGGPIRSIRHLAVLNGGTFYLLTDDNKAYIINATFPTTTKIPGFEHLMEAEVSITKEQEVEGAADIFYGGYIGTNGIAYSFSGDLYDDYVKSKSDLMNSESMLRLSSFDILGLQNKKIATITNYEISGKNHIYSIRDNEGTETYSFVKNAKPVSHVKMNCGIYKDGNNTCVLILREDNTFWKLVVETGEFVRLDEEFNGSEAPGTTAPETPEKTEPEEGENKDTEPKETSPSENDKKEPVNTGDISGDGKVDVTDLTMISLGLLGDLTLNETESQFADVNHDGKVDLADLATLRQFLSKKISSLA